jgi:hypothetical protein
MVNFFTQRFLTEPPVLVGQEAGWFRSCQDGLRERKLTLLEIE